MIHHEIDTSAQRTANLNAMSAALDSALTRLARVEEQVENRPQSAGATRPAASSVSAGTCFFDTLLGRPVWSDGEFWRDANGAYL